MRELNEVEHVDIEQFYGCGGLRMMLDSEELSHFEVLYEHLIDWEPDPDGIYNLVPKGVRPTATDWKKGLEDPYARSSYMNKVTLENTPPALKKKVVDLLVSDRFKPFASSFDFEVGFIDLWQGSEGCGWHWDGLESVDFLVLLYVTDHDVWPAEKGGELYIGKRLDTIRSVSDPLSVNVDMPSVDVDTLVRISPRNGTLVVLNNRDPRFVHRCNLMTEKVDKRITLTFGVSFKKKGSINDELKVSIVGDPSFGG